MKKIIAILMMSLFVCASAFAADEQQPAEQTETQEQKEQEQAPETNVELPEIYKIALSKIGSVEKRAEVQEAAKEHFALDDHRSAAEVIGRAVAAQTKNSQKWLGDFCVNTLPKIGPVEAQADFLAGFMRGYSGIGILIFTTDSVQTFRVCNIKTGNEWESSNLYIGNGVVFAPFTRGRDFLVHIFNNGENGVKMWKIMPDYAKVRHWGPGLWEKEITVRGSK